MIMTAARALLGAAMPSPIPSMATHRGIFHLNTQDTHSVFWYSLGIYTQSLDPEEFKNDPVPSSSYPFQ